MGSDPEDYPYSFVGDAYGLGGGAGRGPTCFLPQRGGDGNDTPQTLPPTQSNDAIRAGGGDDKVRGDAGNDCLYGQDGSDQIKGDAGDDLLTGGDGDDRVSGGSGIDRLRCGEGDDVAVADRKDTVSRSCERVTLRLR